MRVGSTWPARWRAALVAAVWMAGAGCASGRAVSSGPAARGPAPSALDVTTLYEKAGLIAEGTPVPFVGAVEYFATARPDSTLALLTLSLPGNGLTFVREGDRYRAGYEVAADVRAGGLLVRHLQGSETVRVASFKETSREDESVVFQQFFALPVGSYTMQLSVRDVESGRVGTHQATLTVPQLVDGRLSSVVPVYRAEPRPRRDTLPALVANPRATAVFGRDSAMLLYVEAYGRSAGPLHATVRSAQGETLWEDTVTLPRVAAGAAGVLRVPVARLLPGVGTVLVWRADAADTARSPFIVSFGEGLAVTSFDEMLSYLRYFTTSERLQALRRTPADQRAAAWLAFLRATDPAPNTPENEALRDYFQRLTEANQRFREEGGPGWLTERGMVFVSLGEPDQIFEQGAADLVGQRGRTQVWQYAKYRTQLVFVDQSGFGRWQLTPSSEAEFQSLVQRLRETPGA